MPGGFQTNSDIIAANLHRSYCKYYYNGDGQIEYTAWHLVHGADDSHPKWVVSKYTYDVSGNLTITEQLEGAVENRASLDWV